MGAFLENIPATQYFERHSDSLFAEPFNALSNIAFFIAAHLVYRLSARFVGTPRLEGMMMAGLLFAVGIGSSLYHTARSPYTLILDVAPIAIFILLAMFLLFRWLFKSTGWSALCLAIFIVAQAMLPRGIFNGSLPYALALVALVGITVGAFKKCGSDAIPLLVACVFFWVAIVFRAVDLVPPGMFPMGTHWLWHIFAAVSAHLTARFILQTAKSHS